MRFGDLTQGSAKPPPGCLSDLPRSGLRTQPGVLTPGTHPTRRVALKGRKVKFGITSEYGLARHTTRSLVMDLGQDKRTILFDAIASYASFYRALSAVCYSFSTLGRNRRSTILRTYCSSVRPITLCSGNETTERK